MTGYIGEFEYVDDHRAGKIVVELNGRLNKCGVISPRFDVGVKEIEGWTARLLPSRQVCILTILMFSRQKHVWNSPCCSCQLGPIIYIFFVVWLFSLGTSSWLPLLASWTMRKLAGRTSVAKYWASFTEWKFCERNLNCCSRPFISCVGSCPLRVNYRMHFEGSWAFLIVVNYAFATLNAVICY